MAALETGTAKAYAAAGVDQAAADRFVEKISALTRSTMNRRVKAAVGGYASVYELDRKRWIAASTDGVGTKLKLAFRLREHRTIGIDLVAMSVNDLLCVGAEPLFFLDYFATGKLEEGVGVQVLEGIVEGCRQAKVALVGGETAEMPDFYAHGEYDLGGFAVGSLEPRRLLPKRQIRKGDVLIGLGSSGPHSNGYSLIRKLLPQGPEGDGEARKLLEPTRIYVKSCLPLVQKGLVKGMAHVTGSGFLNVPRMSEKVSYRIELPALEELAPTHRWLREKSRLGLGELATTFNCGLGMVMAVSPKHAQAVLRAVRKSGEKAWVVGEVRPRSKGKPSQVEVVDPSGLGTAVLDY
jgi:phosphoribosylformylglycinamidine cyclo-ligase